ncbi:MAG TPA: CDP-alcohol phosphatidyltransferase family protein [Pilimelia sp.]|nr:CDP-alcohol phosphatidyltransferase family protein [Pilimelia sp.]
MNWEAYAADWADLHGGYDPRRASPLVRGWLRLAYAIGVALGRARVSPNAVTVAGVLLCVAVPVVAGLGPGWPLAAAVLVLVAAVADSVDGAIAVATDRASRLGHVLDSLADRIGELCWAAAFWLIGAPGPLAVGCAALSWLHEYARARANVAGMTGIGSVTVGERPTRVSVSVVGLMLAGAAGLVAPGLAAGTATAAAAGWALLAVVGFGQLFGTIRKTLRMR